MSGTTKDPKHTKANVVLKLGDGVERQPLATAFSVNTKMGHWQTCIALEPNASSVAISGDQCSNLERTKKNTNWR